MEDLVIEKLSTVYDPEVPVNIWELGLVYNIEFPKQNDYNHDPNCSGMSDRRSNRAGSA